MGRSSGKLADTARRAAQVYYADSARPGGGVGSDGGQTGVRPHRRHVECLVTTPPVPSSRVRALNDVPLAVERDYVLYWMIAYRRTTSNFALQRAVGVALELGKPLVVLEALRCGYRWASDRLHRFVIEGMA